MKRRRSLDGWASGGFQRRAGRGGQQATLPVLAHVATVFVSCLEIPSTANLGSNTLACVTNNISLCSCGREMKSVQTKIATATTAEQENLRSAGPLRERKNDGDRFICFTAPSSSTDIVLLSLLLLVNVWRMLWKAIKLSHPKPALRASWYTAWDAPNVHFYFLMLHICGFLCCLDMVLNDSLKEISRFIYMRKVTICILTGDGRIVHLWAVCQLVKLAQRWHCTVVFDIVSPGFVSRLQQLPFIPSLSARTPPQPSDKSLSWVKSCVSLFRLYLWWPFQKLARSLFAAGARRRNDEKSPVFSFFFLFFFYCRHTLKPFSAKWLVMFQLEHY